MKKKWKITIMLLIVVLLSVAIYFTYIIKFKQYDVADEDVKEIISDPYSIELPDGSFISIDEDGEVVESADDTTTITTSGSKQPVVVQNESKGNSDKGATPSTSTSNKGESATVKPSEKKSVSSIKERYVPAFTNLQNQADGKINSLIGRAKTEYSTKKTNGESISYAYFYNKYMGAAKDLESRTDAIFYGTVKAVEADLAKNGYNKSYAQSFIKEYEATKKERRDGILKKAVGN